MKTIEERATSNLMYERDFCGNSLSDNMVCRAYVRGAEEQKAIDIDKACKWITEHIDIPYEGEFIDNSPVASDYIEWCKKRLEYAKTISDALRQSMEE